MKKLADLVGRRFGRLLVKRQYGDVATCECLCDCGNTALVSVWQLTRRDVVKSTKSCGCMKGRRPSKPFEFRYRVNLHSGCWEWINLRKDGYGHVQLGRTKKLAHRESYERATGQALTPRQSLDHLCRNNRCVNPEHLEVVTHLENMRRGAAARKAGAPSQSLLRREFL